VAEYGKGPAGATGLVLTLRWFLFVEFASE